MSSVDALGIFLGDPGGAAKSPNLGCQVLGTIVQDVGRPGGAGLQG